MIHKGLRLFDFFGRDCFVAALLAMTFFSPFFAIPSFAADDKMTVSVPEYIEITKYAGNTTSNISFINSTSFTMPVLDIQYKINTNSTVQVYNYFVTGTTSGTVSAFKGINDTYEYIAFAKNDNSATVEAVEDAMKKNPVPENNKNVIGIRAQHFHYLNFDNNGQIVSRGGLGFYYPVISYSARNNSGYSFMTVSNSAEGTFSPLDSAGVYTATVYITTIAP